MATYPEWRTTTKYTVAVILLIFSIYLVYLSRTVLPSLIIAALIALNIIVLAPILVPVAMHFGIDPVHFGMIMVVNLALGMITPPFGVNLFAACTVARISLDRIIKDLIPFVLVILVCLVVISYVPALSLTLRDLVYAR